MTESGRMPGPPRPTDAGLIWLPAADRVPAPWRNGGGTTAEVMVRGAGSGGAIDLEFDWRISLAAVDGDGDFSLYPGVDRWLMPLSLGGLRLVDDGTIVPVGQYEVHAFPGERAVASVGVTTSTLDLNLMLRRGEATGLLHMVEASGDLTLTTMASEEIVAMVLDGRFDASGNGELDDLDEDPDGPRGVARDEVGHVVRDIPGGAPDGAVHPAVRTLGRHDAVFLGAGRGLALHGVGRLAVARIDYSLPSRHARARP